MTGNIFFSILHLQTDHENEAAWVSNRFCKHSGNSFAPFLCFYGHFFNDLFITFTPLFQRMKNVWAFYKDVLLVSRDMHWRILAFVYTYCHVAAVVVAAVVIIIIVAVVVVVHTHISTQTNNLSRLSISLSLSLSASLSLSLCHSQPSLLLSSLSLFLIYFICFSLFLFFPTSLSLSLPSIFLFTLSFYSPFFLFLLVKHIRTLSRPVSSAMESFLFPR